MSAVLEPIQPDAPAPRRGRPRKRTRAGFGSVRRLPSGRYQARYSDDAGRRYNAPHTFDAKRDAEAWIATQRADMVRGTWRAPALGAVTLGDYATDHLALRLDLRPKTRATYDSLVRTFLTADLELPTTRGRPRVVNLGRTELGSITLATVREWHAAALHRAARQAEQRREGQRARRRREAVHHARAWARQQGIPVATTGRIPDAVRRAWEDSGAPAAATITEPPAGDPEAGRTRVAQAYRLLHMLMQQAVEEGRIIANPCQIARAGQPSRRPDRVPATPGELAKIAAAMPDRYAAAVHLAAWSGLRAGELFGLARGHVDLEAGTLRVERAVEYLGDSTPTLGPPKTAGSRRTVYLPGFVVAILREHMARYTDPAPTSLVFTDPQGRIVPRSVRSVPWRRARAAAGRPDLRWHDLRHTGATLAAQTGATMRELQARLGHSTYAAAMRYQSASGERDQLIAQRLDALAAPTATTPASATTPEDHT